MGTGAGGGWIWVQRWGVLYVAVEGVGNGGIREILGGTGGGSGLGRWMGSEGEGGAASLAIRVVGDGGMPLAGAASGWIAGPTW
jgi:hypothetical protein